jgi:hypothetical protein
LAQIPNANFAVGCVLSAGDPNITDYTANLASTANQLPNGLVTTQFEYSNKELQLASFSAEVNTSTGIALASILVPGTFGTSEGRYILGGYGITEDYNKDDQALCWVSDNNRNIAWALALASNPDATEPLPDSEVIALGVLPAPFNQAFPNYPVIKYYYDSAVATANQGWYFWPTALGNDLGPIGEVEIEAIAGYAFIPAGFFLNIQYNRPASAANNGVYSGGIRVNLDWGNLIT